MSASALAVVCACAALLCTIVCRAPAHAEPPRRVSEAAFLGQLERSDPRFEAVRARGGGARADVLDARALANPSLAYDREEVFASAESLADDLVRLSFPLDVSGARSRRIAAAEAATAAASRDADREAWLLRIAGLASFHDAAFRRLRVEALRTAREELAAVVEVVRSRRRAGDVAGYDLARLELELGTAADALAGAEAELAAARATLARLLGDPAGAVDADSSLELPPLPAAAEALVALALNARSDRAAAAFRVRAADAELGAAERGWVPGLDLTAGFKSSDLGAETAVGYVAGIKLSVPLFDRRQGARARADARRREQQALSRALDLEIGGAVRAARDALARRIEQTRSWRETQLPRAALLLRAAGSSYREGERPIFELLDAARAAREVRLRELELRRDAKRAELDLWLALGKRP